MKRSSSPLSSRWIARAATGIAALAGGERLAALTPVGVTGVFRGEAARGLFRGGYENVLGTSLDLVIEAARPSDAAECEARLLGEIERLRKILSTYDPASEISRVMAGAPVVSTELAELLAAYETWTAHTGGLINVNLGGVIAAWREAAHTGRVPEPTTLAAAANHARAYNVDALGKAFIIDRAVALARRHAPGGLIDLGGDIRAWGETAWPVAIADPRHPADNALPLARFMLRDAAVATSGGYARFSTVGGKRFSHLIDPRTLWPLTAGGGATVIAPDCVTANALSTAASIAGSDAGAALAEAHGATGWLFASTAGQVSRGGSLSMEPAATASAPAAPANPPSATPPAANPWPAGFQVSLSVVLKTHTGPREIFRPYVAVWIEDASGRVVRNLAVWGTEPNWQRKLTMWSYQTGGRRSNRPVTSRATRAPGTYALVWDGADDYGHRLSAGTYKLSLEIVREDGNHVLESVQLVCAAEPVSAELRATSESDASTVSYGPAKN